MYIYIYIYIYIIGSIRSLVCGNKIKNSFKLEAHEEKTCN